MFGELVTLDGRQQFGNLMAVRLLPAGTDLGKAAGPGVPFDNS